MLIFLCSTTPKFNSKNSQFINKKSKSTIKRDQTINGFHNKVNQDLKSIKMVDSIDMPSLEKTKKIREDFDVGDLEHSFIFRNLNYKNCTIEDNSEILIIFFYISLILFFFLSIHGFSLNIMSISTRNSFKDLLLWSDNLIFFGSLIFLGIFLILFIFLVIKYKLYNVCFNDCNNLLLDYKAKNFKQEILDIISLYDKKSQLYIIKIFFKNKNIPSIIEKMKKKIEKTQNPEIHDQKELINTKIEELLCNYNEKDWQICTQNRENISKIYDLTEYDSTINKNKSNSILLFFKNHLYMTIILMILCPLAIAFSFANENLEILNPTLCSGVFLFFILYFIYFLFFMIKVRKQNIKKYIIFFKKLELVRDESIVFDAKLGFTKKISVHKFTHNLTESINLASNQSEN